ncbi:hypothetical protein GCM10020331_078120 [Ectobacillus funiculus]
MSQEIEIEFKKNMLTKEEFHRLCESFAITTFIKQVNHYFETSSFFFKRKKAQHCVFVRKKMEHTQSP